MTDLTTAMTALAAAVQVGQQQTAALAREGEQQTAALAAAVQGGQQQMTDHDRSNRGDDGACRCSPSGPAADGSAHRGNDGACRREPRRRAADGGADSCRPRALRFC